MVSEVMAKVESEALATVVAFDRSYTTASTRVTTRWNTNMAIISTKVNHTLSMAVNAVLQTARSLAALRNGVTTSIRK